MGIGSDSGRREGTEAFPGGVYAVGEGSPADVRRCDRREDGLWIPRQSPGQWDFWTVLSGRIPEEGDDGSLEDVEEMAVIPRKTQRGLAQARLFAASKALYHYVERWAEAGDEEAQRLVEIARDGTFAAIAESAEVTGSIEGDSPADNVFSEGLYGGIYGVSDEDDEVER